MMKNALYGLMTLAILALTTLSTQAQIKTPAASPSAEFKQTVGLTDISVVYARPAAKGRELFAADGLVPFDATWRTGANSATKITFSDEVMVGDAKLAKGSYAILTVPSKEMWKIMFYTYESGDWSSYAKKEAAGGTGAKVMMGEHAENFTIAINNITMDAATLDFSWGKTKVSLPIKVEVAAKVEADIKRTLGGPSAGDYYAAASYYHDAGKDLKQALEWVQKATKVENPMFWQVRREAMILADLGQYKEAIKAAELSMQLAEKANNEDYVRMNKQSIMEWSKKK